MSREALEEIFARALEDDAFRARLLESPVEALEDYDLSVEERNALIVGDLRQVLHALDLESSSSASILPRI